MIDPKNPFTAGDEWKKIDPEMIRAMEKAAIAEDLARRPDRGWGSVHERLLVIEARLDEILDILNKHL